MLPDKNEAPHELNEKPVAVVGCAAKNWVGVIVRELPPKLHATPCLEQSLMADGGSAPVSALLLRSRLARAIIPANMSGMEPYRLVLWVLITSDVSAMRADIFGRLPALKATRSRIGYAPVTRSDVLLGRIKASAV